MVTLLDYQEGRWPYFWASTFRIYVNQPHRTPHSDSCQRGSLQPSAVQFYQMSQRGASDFRQDSWREAGLPGLRLVCAFPGSGWASRELPPRTILSRPLQMCPEQVAFGVCPWLLVKVTVGKNIPKLAPWEWCRGWH